MLHRPIDVRDRRPADDQLVRAYNSRLERWEFTPGFYVNNNPPYTYWAPTKEGQPCLHSHG